MKGSGKEIAWCVAFRGTVRRERCTNGGDNKEQTLAKSRDTKKDVKKKPTKTKEEKRKEKREKKEKKS